MVSKLSLKILIVDDTRVNLMLLNAALSQAGHHIVMASSGEEAVARFQSDKPDVVLMDVTMPGIGGIEATRQIRALGSGDWVPIIFISALAERDDMVHGLDAGGDDYLAKPVDLILLKAKINAMQRIALLKGELRASNIELTQYQQNAEYEMEMARDLLDHMLRESSSPIEEVQTCVRAASNLSGDLIITQRSQQRDYLLLADAMGHGLPAALPLMPLVQVFSSMALAGRSVGAIVRVMNAQIKALLPAGNFVSATLLSIDRQNHVCEIWNGGNPPALLLNERGELRQQFSSCHLALGIVKEDEFDDSVEVLHWQDSQWLVLYSDGVPDALSPSGVAFGEESILQAVQSSTPHAALLAAVDAHLAGQDALDDVSIATVHLLR